MLPSSRLTSAATRQDDICGASVVHETNRNHSWGHVRVKLERFGGPKTSSSSAVGRVSTRARARHKSRCFSGVWRSSLFAESAGSSTHSPAIGIDKDSTPRIVLHPSDSVQFPSVIPFCSHRLLAFLLLPLSLVLHGSAPTSPIRSTSRVRHAFSHLTGLKKAYEDVNRTVVQ
jgi:hypothetical protein